MLPPVPIGILDFAARFAVFAAGLRQRYASCSPSCSFYLVLGREQFAQLQEDMYQQVDLLAASAIHSNWTHARIFGTPCAKPTRILVARKHMNSVVGKSSRVFCAE